ncbi:hypothetical protein E6C27_scaffold749G00920 [Cucumis melo var. makuwa]|uniref:Uncharacterized protein n=1 Tax=Cucumis melo var. makuwa TaxID=1194695 RepID=A0A5A7V2A6_CUCMM|nr:hypothetical protein E6C27_scaffold749G00920 [Cucumis melo var. makuwa]
MSKLNSWQTTLCRRESDQNDEVSEDSEGRTKRAKRKRREQKENNEENEERMKRVSTRADSHPSNRALGSRPCQACRAVVLHRACYVSHRASNRFHHRLPEGHHFVEPSLKPSENRCRSQPCCRRASVASNPSRPTVKGIPLGIIKDQLVPMGAQIAPVRGRASSGAEAEVRTRASWRVTRSDRGGP